MKKHLLTAAFALAAACGPMAAADADPVLMTVDGHDIRVSEFEYLYNKNNTQQMQPQTLDQYLGMFVNYKLKVADAEHAGLDTAATFRTEYDGFKRDLAKPYMRDASVEERLIQEAYDRRRTDVKVSHIMMSLEEGNDVRLDSIRREILAGNITFEDAARQYSIDRGSSGNGGLMGFVVPGRFPYSFEMASYSTPVGQISDVVNSGVGYHLVRVESTEPNRGEILAEHILLLTRGKTPEEAEQARVRIDSLHAVAVAGADFQDLARRFSQDPGTARNGGALPWFGSGAMVAEFDSAAYAIPDGAISAPFKTNFGYHIIHRVDSRQLPPLDELRSEILRSMGNDDRANMPEQAVTERIMSETHAAVNPKSLKKVRKMIEKCGSYDSTAIVKLCASNLVMATFDGGEPVLLRDVMPYVPFTLSVGIDNAVDMIGGAAYGVLKNSVLDHYRNNLAETNTEYRNLLNEYRDGILLYDISNSKVWERAAKDSAGLEEFFRNNRDRYAWSEPKFKSFIIFASSDSVLNAALAYADSLSTDNPVAFVTEMRQHFGREVKVERVIAARGENPITDYLAFGGDKPAADARSTWAAYAAYKGRIIDAPETAADVRGAAVTDYQAELDRLWVEELHRKYPVHINQDVFEALKARRQ